MCYPEIGRNGVMIVMAAKKNEIPICLDNNVLSYYTHFILFILFKYL